MKFIFKMLVGILVSTLFALAHAQLRGDSYAEYADAIDEAQYQLDSQILSMDDDIPDIRDSRRHYAVLVTHIAMVANEIAGLDGVDIFEVYLNLLPQSIAYALNNVQDVIDQTAIAIQSIKDDTKKVRSLLETLCPPDQTNEVCDQIVSEAIEANHDRYYIESVIMQDLGQAADLLLKENLVAVVEKYEEVEYLLENMYEMTNIIFRVADFISLDRDM